MAVYTHLNPEQWQEVAKRLGYDDIVWKEEKRGTSDTKYVITLTRNDTPPVTAMANIIETPDVHINGTPSEKAIQIPRLIEHIGRNSLHYDRHGKKVNFGVPTPMMFDDSSPYVTMGLPSKKPGEGPVAKTIYITPYIPGHTPNYRENIPNNIKEARKYGAANAAWLNAASGFADAEKLPAALPISTWKHYVEELHNNPATAEKLAQYLKATSNGNSRPDNYWQSEAKMQIQKLYDAVNYVAGHWDEKTRNLPRQVINGDPFPDNAILTDNGTVIIVDHGAISYNKNTDIAMGLNGVCMGPGGKLDERAASAYLKAYNEVRPMSKEEKDTLAFMGQVSAVKWGLFRTRMIANAPDASKTSTRPVAGTLQQYDFWHEAEKNNERVADRLLGTSRAWKAGAHAKATISR